MSVLSYQVQPSISVKLPRLGNYESMTLSAHKSLSVRHLPRTLGTSRSHKRKASPQISDTKQGTVFFAAHSMIRPMCGASQAFRSRSFACVPRTGATVHVRWDLLVFMLSFRGPDAKLRADPIRPSRLGGLHTCVWWCRCDGVAGGMDDAKIGVLCF